MAPPSSATLHISRQAKPSPARSASTARTQSRGRSPAALTAKARTQSRGRSPASAAPRSSGVTAIKTMSTRCLPIFIFDENSHCHVPIVSWYLLSRGTYCLVVPIVTWYILSLGTYCHVPIVKNLFSLTYCHIHIVKYLLSSTYCHVPILPNRITLISIVMGAYFGSEMCARHYLKCETCFKMYLHQN